MILISIDLTSRHYGHYGYDTEPSCSFGCKDTPLAKESVAPSWQISAGWIPESMDRWSVGVGRRHPVTMRKASCKTLSMRRV